MCLLICHLKLPLESSASLKTFPGQVSKELALRKKDEKRLQIVRGDVSGPGFLNPTTNYLKSARETGRVDQHVDKNTKITENRKRWIDKELPQKEKKEAI